MPGLTIAPSSVGTVRGLSESTSWDPIDIGERAIREVGRFIDSLPSEMSGHAARLMARHEYVVDSPGEGPHTNVMGHPLFALPLWVDSATGNEGRAGSVEMLDICVSSLFGYLSVRADDDYFDGEWTDAEAAMMLSAVFRARHQALLAIHLSDNRFWTRFENVWQGYAEAMLLEKELHKASSTYSEEDFNIVLGRSQPLEIPASAVLALRDRWDLAPGLSDLVRHLTRATQIFDDFVDAPDDLASGRHTLMVRRLGGQAGPKELRRSMLDTCEEIMAEAGRELDLAIDLAERMEIGVLSSWADERKDVMSRACATMVSALFQQLNTS